MLNPEKRLLQNACAKAVTGKYKHDHLGNDLKELHWLNIKKRVIFKIGLLAYKAVTGVAPLYLQELFKYSRHGHHLKLIVPYKHCVKSYGHRSFSFIGPKLLNSLPLKISTSLSVNVFKAELKTFLYNMSDYEINALIS